MVTLGRIALYTLLIAGMLHSIPAAGDSLILQTASPLKCRSAFEEIQRQILRLTLGSDTQPLLDPRLDNVDSRILTWLRHKNTTFPNKLVNGIPFKNAGETIAVGDNNFEILARLGYGSEAAVYLVQTPGGIRAAKVFFSSWAMSMNRRALAGETAFRTPRVFVTDLNNNTVLLEHLEVLPVSEIAKHYEALGISVAEKDEILRAWAIAKKRAESIRGRPPGDYNVGYSFRDREFQMFDPH